MAESLISWEACDSVNANCWNNPPTSETVGSLEQPLEKSLEPVFLFDGRSYRGGWGNESGRRFDLRFFDAVQCFVVPLVSRITAAICTAG